MSEYLDMISRKTGALIRCALNVGALLGARDGAAVGAFRECGSSLGLVFQIRDDVLGTWGDEDATGKPVGADIRRKKNTLPAVYAMSQARGRDRELLLTTYRGNNIGDREVARVLDVMDRVGAKDYAQSLAAEHCGASTGVAFPSRAGIGGPPGHGGDRPLSPGTGALAMRLFRDRT